MTTNRHSEDRNAAAAEHFHKTAKGWSDRYTEGNQLSPMFFVRRQAVAALLEKLAGGKQLDRAIDFGCGTGPYLPLLRQHAREVVGIDIAEGMIDEAKRNVPADIGGVTLQTGSVLDLPFPDNHFDLAVTVGVVEYFDEPEAMLREALRVMKPGAPIVITLPNKLGVGRISGLPRTASLLVPPSWKIKVGAIADRLRGREPDPSNYYLGQSYTANQVKQLCERVGGKVVDMMTSGYDSWRVVGVPIPNRVDDKLRDSLETRRDEFPWKYVGNNIIVTIAK